MKCQTPRLTTVTTPHGGEVIKPFPCGKCIPCFQKKRNDWSIRLNEEAKHHIDKHFITLTYADWMLPETLKRGHIQSYFKKLRHSLKGKLNIRYYYVGEYGTKTGRPHWHIILFGCPSEVAIRTSWTNSSGKVRGHVHIGQVTEASITYALKYVLQPGERVIGMSRKYGLGAHYLTDEVIEWHRNGLHCYYPSFDTKLGLPRFYRDKIWYRKNLTEKKCKVKRYDENFEPVILQHPDREKIGLILQQEQRKNERRNLKLFIKKYGKEGAKRKQAEFRTAELQRLSNKIKFSQKF